MNENETTSADRESASNIVGTLAKARRDTRKAIGVHGASWVVAVVLLIAGVSCLADWLLNLSPAVRIMLLGVLIVGFLWSAYTLLVRSVFVPFSNLDMAMRVEARYPDLKNKLTSAVEFLRVSSSPGESRDLQTQVIHQAARRLDRLDIGSVLDWRRPKAALIVAGLVCLLASGVAIASPVVTGLALKRLVNPLGDTNWPRQTFLVLNEYPKAIAEGTDFEASVEVKRGIIPEEAKLFWQTDGGEVHSAAMRLTSKRAFAGNLASVQEPFEFWVEAGDAATVKCSVDVQPPPVFADLQLELSYPSYTGKEPERLAPGQGSLQAIWGTKVHLTGRSTKPLREATFRSLDGTNSRHSRMKTSRQDKISFDFEVTKAMSYWFELLDQDGFRGDQSSRFEVRPLDDQKPKVLIEQPRANIEILPGAKVPLEILAQDDFGLREGSLVFSLARAADGGETQQAVPIWESSQRLERADIEYQWDLAALALVPGDRLTYHVKVRDNDSLRGPNEGVSRKLRIQVLTREQLLTRIEQRQHQVFRELQRSRDLQREAASRTAELKARLDQGKQVDRDDSIALQSTQSLQRRTHRLLAGSADSIQARVDRILEDFERNDLQDPDGQRVLSNVKERIARLNDGRLPAIELALSRGSKAAQNLVRNPDSDPSPLRSQVNQASKSQEQVLDALDELVGQMNKWQSNRELARELADLIQFQKQLASESDQIGKQTLGKQWADLASAARGDLAALATRQNQARERLGRILSNLEEVIGQQLDSTTLDALREAEQIIVKGSVDQKMTRSAALLLQNQTGNCVGLQAEVVATLEAALKSLEKNAALNLSDLTAQLREMNAELTGIRQEQGERREAVENSEDLAGRARRQELLQQSKPQAALGEQVAELLERLQRTPAAAAANALTQALNQMEQATSNLQKGDGDTASGNQKAAERNLANAQKELGEMIAALESRLRAEQKAQLGELFEQLKKRQKQVLSKTVELDEQVKQQGTWRRSLLAKLRGISDSESGVLETTQDTEAIVKGDPVFEWVLSHVVEYLKQSVKGLTERSVGEQTQAAERAALDRLEQLVTALESEQRGEPGDENQKESAGSGGSNSSEQDGPKMPSLAQLRLLYALQISINKRTTILSQRTVELSDQEQSELKTLTAEQGELARLVEQLVAPPEKTE